MVNNSTNINKTSSHLSPEIIEYKKKDREQDKSLPQSTWWRSFQRCVARTHFNIYFKSYTEYTSLSVVIYYIYIMDYL